MVRNLLPYFNVNSKRVLSLSHVSSHQLSLEECVHIDLSFAQKVIASPSLGVFCLPTNHEPGSSHVLGPHIVSVRRGTSVLLVDPCVLSTRHTPPRPCHNPSRCKTLRREDLTTPEGFLSRLWAPRPLCVLKNVIQIPPPVELPGQHFVHLPFIVARFLPPSERPLQSSH